MNGAFAAAARRQRLDAMGREPYDMLVIGGGITGVGIARDAAMRGLRVALAEREDFGSGTSSRSSRLVHGGLRYLEHGHLHLVFESSRERRILTEIAPHLVRPMAFVWPVYDGARVPGWKLATGLVLYDVLSLFRNVGGTHSRLGSEEVVALEPALRRHRLRGGARYFDASTDDSRLTLANARAAVAAGAAAVNHLEVTALRRDADRVTGAMSVDRLGGEQIAIEARTVVNATGPWSDAVRRLAEPDAVSAVRGTKGVHVAVPRERVGNRGALTILSEVDGRVMFVLPAGPLTIVGTTETDYRGPSDRVRATRADVAYLLRSANAYFPEARLEPKDVVSAWAGLRPLADGRTREARRASREHAISWTVPGLLTVTGGKLTTYRAMAAEAVDAVQRALDLPVRRSRTDRVSLPGGDVDDLEEEVEAAAAAVGMPAVAEHLVRAHGSDWRAVWEIVGSNAALAAPVAPTLPYIVAELVFAVEEEMAMTLGDLLLRRLHIAFETRDHGISAAPAVARVVAPALGWSADDMTKELARYRDEIERMFGIED